jgi:hypothetical protein
MDNELPLAERMNYWKTGRASPDSWLDKTIAQIEKLGGTVFGYGFGREHQTAKAAYMIQFSVGEDYFKVVWPVLPTETGNSTAAMRQAATMLYHDTKAKCLKAYIFGARTAFFEYLILPDGRTAMTLSNAELQDSLPDLLVSGGHHE